VRPPRFVLRHWHSGTLFDPIGRDGPANITANILRLHMEPLSPELPYPRLTVFQLG